MTRTMKRSRSLPAPLLILLVALVSQTLITVASGQSLTYCDKANNVYCLNESTCKPNWADVPDVPCDCPTGFVGKRCEFKCKPGDNTNECLAGLDLFEELCDLECDNGGTCVLGTDNFSGIWTSDAANMYCECPTGFTGTVCEHQVEICGDDNHVCLHGSKCKLLNQADGSYGCECSDAWTPQSMFAGKFCQHHHTDMCTPTGVPEFFLGMAVPAFCVNDGVCKSVVNQNQEVHPGCDCPALYDGPHCEFLISKLGLASGGTPANDNNNNNSNIRSPGLGVLAVVLVALVAVVATFGARRVGRKLRRKKQAPVNLQSFRDENFGALSPNGNMLFPAFSMDVVEGARLRDVELT